MKGGMRFSFGMAVPKWFYEESYSERQIWEMSMTPGMPGFKLEAGRSFNQSVENTIHLKVGSLVIVRLSTFLFSV